MRTPDQRQTPTFRTRSRPQSRRPSLLTSVSVISLLVVIGIGAVLGVVLQSSLRNRAISDAARTGEVAANVGVRPFLSPSDLERDFMPLPDERIEALDVSLGESLSPNGIVRLKVWNRQHWLVYSDNPLLRGRWFAGDDVLERSFAGEVTSEVTDLTAPEEREEREFGELLAVYVPLFVDEAGEFTSDQTAEVVGAFEIYLPWAPIAETIRADTLKLWASLAIGLLVLYLALFELVSRASRQLSRQAEENLYIATHDPLTGLVNREAFHSAIVDRVAGRRPDSDVVALVLLFDLERFQVVNDTLGHRTGDKLLEVLAQRLVQLAGPDDIVARLGGDEFALLVPGCSFRDIDATVGLMARVMNTTVELEGLRVEVNARVGATILEGEADADEALQQADIALYEAKRKDSEVEFFRPELDRYSGEALALASEVRTGLERREFDLHYQPKYSLVTGTMTGVEALVRWNHPERGQFSPGAFMPVVEQLPIGRELTNYIIERAVKDMRSWHERGLEIGVAVNLSSRDVNDPSLALFVEAALRSNNIAGAWMTLELTEGTMLADEERTIETLDRLRSMGCGVAVDDFGTGYASISYLVRLPATEVKVDRAFIAKLEHDHQARKIVEHCVGLARSLGMSVTAEGIETARAEHLAAELGCDTGQGFFRSRPMTLEDLHRLVSERAVERTPAPATSEQDQAVLTGVNAR